MEEKKLKFSDCTAAMMQDLFGLTQAWESPVLQQWLGLSQEQEIEAADRVSLEKLQATFVKMGDTWNDIELIEYFVAPIFVIIDFNTPYFKIFSERRISAVVGDYELYGEPDACIAKGTYYPKTPFFCFNEYKRLEEARGDTLGQLLAAMLAAQTGNPAPHPIYGVHVIDQAWYFTALQGKTYTVSHSFAADTEHLFDIFKLLKALKAILIEIAQQDA